MGRRATEYSAACCFCVGASSGVEGCGTACLQLQLLRGLLQTSKQTVECLLQERDVGMFIMSQHKRRRGWKGVGVGSTSNGEAPAAYGRMRALWGRAWLQCMPQAPAAARCPAQCRTQIQW
jgi:hypothetical protein